MTWFWAFLGTTRPASQWRAFADSLSHRLVPLSPGAALKRNAVSGVPISRLEFLIGAGHCKTAIPRPMRRHRSTTPRSRCTAYATGRGSGDAFRFLPVGFPAKPPPVPCRCCPCWRRSRSSGACQDTSASPPTDALDPWEKCSMSLVIVPFTPPTHTSASADTRRPREPAKLTSSGPEGLHRPLA